MVGWNFMRRQMAQFNYWGVNYLTNIQREYNYLPGQPRFNQYISL